VLTVEISCIYKRHGRVRKVHSLLLAPGFDEVIKINRALSRIGNISSDGRPILGLDAMDLLKIALDASEHSMLIPAHAWTPHFGVFGSKTGFDTMEDAFGDLAENIYAIETGLSSDPLMNWRIKALDNIALISNSDAHSPRKLGREANIFDTELSYFAIEDAIKKNNMMHFKSTIEFFPEQGKYHMDGHRECEIRMTPMQRAKANGICPVCKKQLTIGVLSRIEELADRACGDLPKKARPFRSIAPLPEVIAHIVGVSTVASKRVDKIYFALLQELGNEFYILLNAPKNDIEQTSSKELADAIERMRQGRVIIEPGYDGKFGIVRTDEQSSKI
jgi:uncharacterized protein (TIGR00375 family)